MREFHITDVKYRDQLARKKRRLFVLKLAGGGVFVAGLAAAGLYAFFFAKTFAVNTVVLKGLETIDESAILARVNETIHAKKFGRVETQRNIFLLNTSALAERFLSEYPKLRTIIPRKNYFHGVEFAFQERQPLGIWCRKDNCSYFDDEGKTWGPALRSSGFLLLTIQDERDSQEKTVSRQWLDAIRVLGRDLPSLDLGIKTIVIPADSFHDFRIRTAKGYDLLMSLDSDIAFQLNALKLLLDKKGRGFAPAQVDLRIDGRIYYK